MNNRNKTVAASVTAVALSTGMMGSFMFGEPILRATAGTFINPDTSIEETIETSGGERPIIYWTWGNDDPNDIIPEKTSTYNFGADRDSMAYAAIIDGLVDTKLEWILGKDNDGTGDFYYSMYVDPALCAAIACDLDQLGVTDPPILEPESDLPVEERPDAAHLRFLENYDEWDEALERITEILTDENTTYELRELNNYVSAMYMDPHGGPNGIPLVIVRHTYNAGGHFVIFHVMLDDGSIVDVRIRLECGYQPIDVPGWNPPGPTPTPTATPTPTSPPASTPTPTPPPPPWIPSPTPTPIPKNPENDPIYDSTSPTDPFVAPDPTNHNPDTSGTPEPFNSNVPYVAPTAPVVTPTPTVAPTATPTPPPNTVIETGDTSSLPDLSDVADPANPNRPEVDPALQGDPVNSGEVTGFE